MVNLQNFIAKFGMILTNSNYLKSLDEMIIPLQNIDMQSYVPSYIFLNKTNNIYSNFRAKLSVPHETRGN